jgi:hypothetical protein
MRATVLVLVGVLLLTGCAGGAGTSPRAAATPVPALGCGGGGAAAAGAVPDGFRAAEAYLCDEHATQDDAKGTWSGTRLTRLEGDLAPLLKALAEPDEPRWPGPCPAIAFAGPLLWLGDGAGNFVRVAYPANGCGLPRTDAVFAALDALTVVDEHFEPDQLIDSTAARRDGCPSAAPSIALLGRPALPAPDLPAAPPLSVCRYEADLPASDAPDASVSSPAYTGVTSLTPEEARAVLEAARIASPVAAACHRSASRLVALVADSGAAVTVELDGCRRLIDRAHRAFTASDALVTLLQD